MAIGMVGSFFRELGGTSIALAGVGAGVDALAHGVGMKGIAKYLAKRKHGVNPTDEQILAEMNKADLAMTGIAGGISASYGIVRVTKFDYESDMLDVIGLMAGGALLYEAGSSVEVVGSLLKLGEV